MTLQRGNAAFIDGSASGWTIASPRARARAAAQGDLDAEDAGAAALEGAWLGASVASRAYHTHPALWIRPQHTYLPQRFRF